MQEQKVADVWVSDGQQVFQARTQWMNHEQMQLIVDQSLGNLGSFVRLNIRPVAQDWSPFVAQGEVLKVFEMDQALGMVICFQKINRKD